MNFINFMVMGEPMSKQRPRVTTIKGYARAYTPKDTLNYENKVLMSYQEKLKELCGEDLKVLFPQGTFVKLKLEAWFPLTKGDYGKNGLNKKGREKLDYMYCDKHKDLDNIIKIVLDALNGIAFADDKQIVVIESFKAYSSALPYVSVTLEEIKKGEVA